MTIVRLKLCRIVHMTSDKTSLGFISSKETGRRTCRSNQTRLRLEGEAETDEDGKPKTDEDGKPKFKFPQRIVLGPRTVVYLEAEVDEWIRNRLRGGGRVVPRGERRARVSPTPAHAPE